MRGHTVIVVEDVGIHNALIVCRWCTSTRLQRAHLLVDGKAIASVVECLHRDNVLAIGIELLDFVVAHVRSDLKYAIVVRLTCCV